MLMARKNICPQWNNRSRDGNDVTGELALDGAVSRTASGEILQPEDRVKNKAGRDMALAWLAATKNHSMF
jgi:hypothetical protein